MRFKQVFKIGNKKVGIGQPCFIIAEISANHHQKFDEAVELVKAAAKSGADAVKLQTYTPDTITLDSDKKWFIVGGKDNPELWKGQTLYQLYRTAYTPWEWQPKLKKIANDLGLIFFSSPFDETAVDFLEKMNVPCYKVASYEANDIPLLKKIAETGKPVIISIAFDSPSGLKLILETLKNKGADEIVVLYCHNTYQAEPNLKDAHLATISDISQKFGVITGFSDNNGGIEIPVMAALMGAAVVEKHLILDRKLGGPDTQFSIEPAELKEMVSSIRKAETARGTAHYGPVNKNEAYNQKFRPSIWVVKDIKKGEKFTPENIATLRPNDGLAPKFYEEVLGKTSKVDIELGTPITWDLIK